MRLTLLLSLVMVITFIVPLFVYDDINVYYETFGFSAASLGEKPWIPITSIFLHGNLEHLLSNLFILIFFGLAVEKDLGWRKMLLIFMLGAFAGDFVAIPVHGFASISIGASAGIFALIGVGMLVRPVDVSFYPFIIPVPLALLGLLYAIFNAYGFFVGPENISYIAHFGGLFVGLMFGVKEKGMKKSLKILLISLAILVILPLILILLF